MRFVVVIAIVGLIGAVPVSAAEVPSRKPGLWKSK